MGEVKLEELKAVKSEVLMVEMSKVGARPVV